MQLVITLKNHRIIGHCLIIIIYSCHNWNSIFNAYIHSVCSRGMYDSPCEVLAGRIQHKTHLHRRQLQSELYLVEHHTHCVAVGGREEGRERGIVNGTTLIGAPLGTVS